MTAYFPPRTRLADLPPVRHIARRSCLGDCGRDMTTARLVCDACWSQLPPRLQNRLRRWRRLDRTGQQLAAMDIATVCARERARPR